MSCFFKRDFMNFIYKRVKKYRNTRFEFFLNGSSRLQNYYTTFNSLCQVFSKKKLRVFLNFS